MKKFVALIATAILASLLLVIPTSPVSADTGVCAGVGDAFVNQGGKGLYYPILGPKNGGNAGPLPFTFNQSTAGSCLPGGKTLAASGTVNGYCGLSSGTGVAKGDGSVQTENFWFIGIGSVLIVGGHITGVAVAVPVPLQESCLPNDATGANQFIVAGVVVKSHPTDQIGKPIPGKFPPALPAVCPNPPACPPV